MVQKVKSKLIHENFNRKFPSKLWSKRCLKLERMKLDGRRRFAQKANSRKCSFVGFKTKFVLRQKCVKYVRLTVSIWLSFQREGGFEQSIEKSGIVFHGFNMKIDGWYQINSDWIRFYIRPTFLSETKTPRETSFKSGLEFRLNKMIDCQFLKIE